MTQKTIILANPRGFCAGVDRAISIVERALEEFGAPIYVRHEVVHNKFVVDNLRAKGAVFVDDLADVPKGATLIYSAHGVSKAVQEEAAQRGFRVFDATCPLVTKSPQRSSPPRCPRLRNHHDRPQRPRRSRRHDGTIASG